MQNANKVCKLFVCEECRSAHMYIDTMHMLVYIYMYIVHIYTPVCQLLVLLIVCFALSADDKEEVPTCR